MCSSPIETGRPAPIGSRRLPARLRAATPRIAAAESAAAMRRFGARLVDGQAATAELIVVQLGDGTLGLFICTHFDEREPAGPAGGHVPHHPDRFDGSRTREELLKIVFP